jgi:hypothetical protein
MRTLTQRLASIQAEMPTVKKGMSNPYFSSKYADINSYIEVLMPLLIKHEVVVLQPLTTLPDGTPAVETRITCETGEVISSVTPLAKISDPQKLGAFITYVRRYSLQSFFLCAAEDDDAESFYDRAPKGTSSDRASSPAAPAGSARRTWKGGK